MSKYKAKGNREDSMYEDGYGLDKRKFVSTDKRKERRFNQAMKTKNIDILLDEEDDEFDWGENYGQEHDWN